MQFSDTTNQQGIIQKIERNCGFNPGDITNNSVLLASFTAEINLALDYIMGVILYACGQWHYDDRNYVDYPLIQMNLNSGQRDYSMLLDGDGNVILGIHKVMVADLTGTFREIYSIDQESITRHTGSAERTGRFTNGLNASGTPTRYAKTGDALFLDVIPNYSVSGGIKVFIDREASHFVPTDTVKKPGFVGLYHEFIAARPSWQYAEPHGLKNAIGLLNQTNSLERSIAVYYANRDKDTPRRMAANVENNK